MTKVTHGHWLFNSIGANRWQWWRRWGVSLYQNNDEFWNFLIPRRGGLVPVFSVSSAHHAIRRPARAGELLSAAQLGKVNLMVLTVPAGALVATGALLLYALIADGLSVRVRARSYTQLRPAQRRRRMLGPTLSYYAGLAPPGGTEVCRRYCGDSSPAAIDGQRRATGPRGRLAPSESENLNDPAGAKPRQRWLDSRTPTQFITARIRKCPEKLEIKPGTDGGAPQLVNHLGTVIKELLLVDENSKCLAPAI